MIKGGWPRSRSKIAQGIFDGVVSYFDFVENQQTVLN